MRTLTRLTVSAVATTAAVALVTPAAQAQTTKFTFEGVTLSDEQTGTIYASTKTMEKKPDYVYCQYQSEDFTYLGYYDEFVEPAPQQPAEVLAFCQANFDSRTM